MKRVKSKGHGAHFVALSKISSSTYILFQTEARTCTRIDKDNCLINLPCFFTPCLRFPGSINMDGGCYIGCFETSLDALISFPSILFNLHIGCALKQPVANNR